MIGPAVESIEQRTELSLLARFPSEIPFNVGSRDRACVHCGALRWGLERTVAHQRKDSEIYSNCCQQGDVTLPMAEFEGPLVPEEMLDLFTGKDKGAVVLGHVAFASHVNFIH